MVNSTNEETEWKAHWAVTLRGEAIRTVFRAHAQRLGTADAMRRLRKHLGIPEQSLDDVVTVLMNRGISIETDQLQSVACVFGLPPEQLADEVQSEIERLRENTAGARDAEGNLKLPDGSYRCRPNT